MITSLSRATVLHRHDGEALAWALLRYCTIEYKIQSLTVPRGVWDKPSVGSLFANRQHVYDVPDNSTIIAAQP